mmetsp:Transcript_26518/g.91293  ORF Transcript_26518/g.91293 Transcript_26518/m.91293 type:complete len:229 (-) Transcript_26518:7-693(-)
MWSSSTTSVLARSSAVSISSHLMLPKSSKSSPVRYVVRGLESLYCMRSGARGSMEKIFASGPAPSRRTHVPWPLRTPDSMMTLGLSVLARNQSAKAWFIETPWKLREMGRRGYIAKNSDSNARSSDGAQWSRPRGHIVGRSPCDAHRCWSPTPRPRGSLAALDARGGPRFDACAGRLVGPSPRAPGCPRCGAASDAHAHSRHSSPTRILAEGGHARCEHGSSKCGWEQ